MYVIHILPRYFKNVKKVEKMKMQGGGERFAFEITEALSKKVKVKLITFGQKRETFYRNRNLILEVYSAVNPLKLLNGFSNPFSLNFLQELKNGDVIHCHGYWKDISFISTIYCKMKSATHANTKKVFVTDHGGGGTSITYLFPYGRLVDGFLVYSKFSARWFIRYGKKVKVVSGGVDPTVFRPVSSVKYRKVAFLGRIMPHKGVNYLIEAMRGVDNSELVIMGRIVDIKFYYYLLSLSNKLDVNARFVIDPSHEEIIRELSTATVLVLPSVYYDIYGKYHSRPELFGLVLLEAMACGTPVICTNVGGMPEVVTDGVDGFVVPPNNPKALREKIAFLLDNPDVAVNMGEKGREKVLKYYTWDKVAERCLHAYSEALNAG